MTQQAKAEIIKHYRKQYKRANRIEKGRILDVIAESTGYDRKHIIHSLNEDVEVPKKITRDRVSRYEPIIEPLEKIWALSNLLCGKRLQPFIPDLIDSLKSHNEIELTEEQEELLRSISSATIDRLLFHARKGLVPKGRATTKPGTLLKSKIPIRTFADWNEDKPGFLEIDLVAHCGDRVDRLRRLYGQKRSVLRWGHQRGKILLPVPHPRYRLRQRIRDHQRSPEAIL